MRHLLASLIVMMPLVAHAANVTITPKALQKGVWVDAECKKQNDEDLAKDPSYAKMRCLCVADISYVELSGIPNAKELNAFILSGAENATRGNAENANERACRGQQTEMPKGDAGVGLTEYQYEVNKAFENNDLLVLAVNAWSNGEGAAHGNPWSAAYTIDKKTGKILGEEDMLGKDYLKVNAYLYETLKTTDGSFLSDCDEFKDGDSFCPAKPELYIDPIEGSTGYLQATEDGLTVQFNVYAVGPYAAGPIGLIIPEKFVKHPAIKKLYGAK